MNRYIMLLLSSSLILASCENQENKKEKENQERAEIAERVEKQMRKTAIEDLRRMRKNNSEVDIQ